MSYIIRRFLPDTDVSKPFDCGNSDLNDFLVESSAKISDACVWRFRGGPAGKILKPGNK